MPLREVQSTMYYDKEGQIKEEDGYLSTSPLPPQTSSTGNVTPPPSWKNLRL
jgi:hypothetical protein